MAVVVQEEELCAIGDELGVSFSTGIERRLINKGSGAREGTRNASILPY